MTDPHRRLQRGLGILGLLLWAPVAAAQVILDAVPGGLVEIPLAAADRARPQAFFGQRRILVMESGARWAGLVGLPLSLVPGRYILQVKLEENEDLEARKFTVYPGRRNQQTPAVPAGPPPDVLDQELAWRDSLDAELPLEAPVPLPAAPLFGHYPEDGNGSASERLTHVAFSVHSEMAIKAPDSGRIAAVPRHGTESYVWIDHGMGLFTLTGPVSETTLQQSDPVAAGRVIGRVIPDDEKPAPRVLYLSVFLNGTAVNPFLIVNIEKESPSGTPAQ